MTSGHPGIYTTLTDVTEISLYIKLSASCCAEWQCPKPEFMVDM